MECVFKMNAFCNMQPSQCAISQFIQKVNKYIFHFQLINFTFMHFDATFGKLMIQISQ